MCTENSDCTKELRKAKLDKEIAEIVRKYDADDHADSSDGDNVDTAPLKEENAAADCCIEEKKAKAKNFNVIFSKDFFIGAIIISAMIPLYKPIYDFWMSCGVNSKAAPWLAKCFAKVVAKFIVMIVSVIS